MARRKGEVDITGALFCLAVQHHWEPHGGLVPTSSRSKAEFAEQFRCDNCGSDRFDVMTREGKLSSRAYHYTQEFRLAQQYADRMHEVYTTKEQYRAAYVQYRRKQTEQKSSSGRESARLRRVK